MGAAESGCCGGNRADKPLTYQKLQQKGKEPTHLEADEAQHRPHSERDDWVVTQSTHTGKYYFFNTRTQESRWKPPFPDMPDPNAPKRQQSSKWPGDHVLERKKRPKADSPHKVPPEAAAAADARAHSPQQQPARGAAVGGPPPQALPQRAVVANGHPGSHAKLPPQQQPSRPVAAAPAPAPAASASGQNHPPNQPVSLAAALAAKSKPADPRPAPQPAAPSAQSAPKAGGLAALLGSVPVYADGARLNRSEIEKNRRASLGGTSVDSEKAQAEDSSSPSLRERLDSAAASARAAASAAADAAAESAKSVTMSVQDRLAQYRTEADMERRQREYDAQRQQQIEADAAARPRISAESKAAAVAAVAGALEQKLRMDQAEDADAVLGGGGGSPRASRAARGSTGSRRDSGGGGGDDDDEDDGTDPAVLNLNNSPLFIKATPEQRTERYARVIERLRNPQITKFTATSCGLDDEFADVLSDFLQSGTHNLTEINLETNRISDRGIIAIAEGLRADQTLRTLKLLGNATGTAAAEALCQALDIGNPGRNTTLCKLTFDFRLQQHRDRYARAEKENNDIRRGLKTLGRS